MDEWVLDAVRWASNEGCTDEEYDSLMSIIANHFPDITGHTPPRRHGTKNPHEHTKDILERVLRHHTSGRRQNCVICRGSSVPCLVSQDMTKALAALRDDLASVNKARTVLRTRADVIGESDLRDRSSAAVLEAFLLLSDVFQDSRDSKIPPAPAEDLQSETTDHTAGQVEKVLRAFDIAEVPS